MSGGGCCCCSCCCWKRHRLIELAKAKWLMEFAACGPCRKSDKRWQAVLREQVPYANTVRLEKYVSSIFEELNWAYSSAYSCLWPAGPSCCQSVLGSAAM